MYDITIKNPNGVSQGVASVTVDGQAHDGNILPLIESGKTAQVIVTLG
jgi:cellobiose phosphorylase